MSADLSTRYLGLELKNPLVIAACPTVRKLEMLRKLEQAGIGAAVFPSLFEEQIEGEEIALQRLYDYQADSFAESLTHFPELGDYHTGPNDYLKAIEEAKKTVSIPIIGSLNGASHGGWIRYAGLIESAGADALELNIYIVPTDPLQSAADVEKRYVELVAAVRQSISLPLAVKLGAQFSSLPHLARQLVEAGADGLVLFNRYLEPDIDLGELQFVPELVLSRRHELRLPLRWIAILRDQLPISLAATSGIQRADDVVKALLVGADVTQVAAAILRTGPQWVPQTIEQLRNWMSENGYESVRQLQGSMSRGNCPNPGDLERANYMDALVNFTMEH